MPSRAGNVRDVELVTQEAPPNNAPKVNWALPPLCRRTARAIP